MNEQLQSKAPLPDMHSDNPRIASYLQILQLKRQFRRGWLRAGIPEATCESVADHSFGCAMLCLLMPEPGVDPTRSALMALVHELGEIHAGDITPHDGISPSEKHRLEMESVDRVLDGLDAPTATLLRDLWQDYETGTSAEAQLVKRMDRLEMCFQAAVYRTDGFGPLTDFFTSAGKLLEASASSTVFYELAKT